MLKDFFLALIPIFVAVDAIGVLPIFVALTENLKEPDKRRIIIQSMITAFCLAAGFILLGKFVFKVLGITVGDFMVAGGTVLFCLAISDIINPVKNRRIPTQEVAAVPLGTPLIVGPAVLTTSMVIIPQYGYAATFTSIVVNILFAGLVFKSSDYLVRVLGDAGSKALSKIMSLLLAAIAIMMVRKGLTELHILQC